MDGVTRPVNTDTDVNLDSLQHMVQGLMRLQVGPFWGDSSCPEASLGLDMVAVSHLLLWARLSEPNKVGLLQPVCLLLCLRLLLMLLGRS